MHKRVANPKTLCYNPQCDKKFKLGAIAKLAIAHDWQS